MSDRFATHVVTNQVPPLTDINLFASDAALTEAVTREGAASSARMLNAFGLTTGSQEARELAFLANRHLPELSAYDRYGRRLDVVTYHPSYHELMRISCAEGLANSVWSHLGPAGGTLEKSAHVIRAANLYLAAQMEPGHCCPLTMTNAAVPVLLRNEALARDWLPLVLSRTYDSRFEPAALKAGLTIGMGMTEKQGGTDVRANTTRALRSEDGLFAITGHKWFMSAPMSDAFLVLAQTEGGLSLFFMPRFLPNGTVNAIRYQRLKDKLGNRSNASSEVEFQDALGWLIGEEGRGVTNIVEMLTYCRLDCAVSSAGLMRSAVAMAVHHAEHRTCAGRALIGETLMQQVLADLSLDVEAAVALSFRLARSFDRARDPRAAAWRRLMTPVTKYWVTKIAAPLMAEAMECLGGNGYVEEWPLALLYREAPVNAIWEGSGNVMALDVLRVLQKEPGVVELVTDELRAATAGDAALSAAFDRLLAVLYEPRLLDARARQLVEDLAKLAAAAILRSQGNLAVADAFIATRITGRARSTYGQGLESFDLKALLERATPNRSG
ncbi:MAG: isovaleryl-CoA dehydrogenase [Deltaproteobacteria bacterium]